jgi:hypothetical protein
MSEAVGPIAFLGILFALGTLATAMSGCCSERMIKEIRSPTGIYIATVSYGDCGATTRGATMVELRQTWHPFSAEGGLVFVVEGDPQVAVDWVGETTLHIGCQGCTTDLENRREFRVFRAEQLRGKVRLKYEFLKGPRETK